MCYSINSMETNNTSKQPFQTTPILRVEKIWKSFVTGDHFTRVLKGISTDIKQGEFVILFGPSGCGKSTLLNTLMGLEHPDSGSVNFLGVNIWGLNSDDRAVLRKNNIGIVYQQQNWVKALNVLDNVALVGSLMGYSKDEATRLAKEKLEVVEMTHRSNYKPYELSSGEQQRISLARSLMSNPSLIIADEPTGNLDIKAGLRVMNIFKKLANEGKAILLVTHNIESLSFADRILFMIDGHIRKDVRVQEGDIEEIKKKITNDLESFIQDVQSNQNEDLKNAPSPTKYNDGTISKRKRFSHFLNSVWYNVVFTLSMFLLLLLYVPSLLLESTLFRKSNISTKVKKFIMNTFNRLENSKIGIKKSISSWDIGEISLGHLMEKKSRTLITVLGMGIGIGFITFLLSIGYGLEGLVVDEMAELEQRKQITVAPIAGSKAVLDKEGLERIKSISGVSEAYPLINVATTIFYGDSQTDVVAYGVDSSYLEERKLLFQEGGNFTSSEKELVVGDEVLKMLGVEASELVNKKLYLQFIPVGKEEEDKKEQDEKVSGAFDSKVEYLVKGVTINSEYPVIYFPINETKELGIDTYSELLIKLDGQSDMRTVRKEIEVLGMKTSSVMDTVSEVEKLFGYLRIALAVIGAVAFVIAILGMVNTLIVSLMERTREVGLLKSLGMQSNEVQKLFITEAMLIAFLGGITGIVLGLLGGLLVSSVLFLISLSSGGEYIGINKVPIQLAIGIIFISVVIGYITGLYPSRRAMKMSPLDALRYE